MKVINFTKKKFEKMETLKLDDSVTNTEANMFVFDYKGKKRVFKNLHRLSGSIFANKLLTLEMLDNYGEYLPKSFVVPEYLASVDGVVSGCIEDYIDGINLSVYLNDPKVDVKDKIAYLNKIGELLEQLKSIRKNTILKNIYINDLHEGNFLIDSTGSLRVIDLDSVRICDNRPFPSKYLTPGSLLRYCYYPKKYIKYDKGLSNKSDEYDYRKELGFYEPNDNSEIFCYIITILNFLYKGNVNSMDIDEFFAYMEYLKKLDMDLKLINAFEKIIFDSSNVNPQKLLSTLTYEQVALASKKMYNLKK